MLGFCVGLIGVSLLFFARNSGEILVASLILYLWNIFDHVDGEIARFRDMKTPTGFFLEITLDYIIVSILPLGISFYLYKHLMQTYVLLWGFLSCISLIFYELVIANYYWSFLKYSMNSKSEKLLTEQLVIEEFAGNPLLVNRYTVILGRAVSRIGSFTLFSGHMVFMLIVLSLANYLFGTSITLWNQKATLLHLFLLPYALIMLVSILIIPINYVELKTRLGKERWLSGSNKDEYDT